MPQSTWWARSSWALVSKALHPSSAARTPSAIVLTFAAAPPCDFQPGEEGAPGTSTGVDLRPVAMAEAHPGPSPLQTGPTGGTLPPRPIGQIWDPILSSQDPAD